MDLNIFTPVTHSSWLIKAIFKHWDAIMQSGEWKAFQTTRRYDTKQVYHMLRGGKPKVNWRGLLYGNRDRPRAMFILWLACQDRLPTKDRLHRFGIVTDGKCVFCILK